MLAERILIVDDNKEFSEELQEILNLSGYEAISVADSAQALGAARRFLPDLILLDLRMQGVNGFELASQLKKQHFSKEIPIIAMSGYFPIDNKSAVMDLSNMASCIKKPFPVTELLSRVETALRQVTRV